MLVARLVDEEIGALASPSMRRVILASALTHGGHDAMPLDPDVLAVFVRTALLEAMEISLGRAAANEVCDRLCALLPEPPPLCGESAELLDDDDDVSEIIPRDTLRIAANTDAIWIVAVDLGRAKTLAHELGELGMTARISPSVPHLEGSRSALILDLRSVPEATSEAWLLRAVECDAVVIAWGAASESDAANIYACEGILGEREVAVYCASLLV